MRVDQYHQMRLGGRYPAIYQMVAEWNRACKANADMAGEPWLEVLDPKPKPRWKLW